MKTFGIQNSNILAFKMQLFGIFKSTFWLLKCQNLNMKWTPDPCLFCCRDFKTPTSLPLVGRSPTDPRGQSNPGGAGRFWRWKADQSHRVSGRAWAQWEDIQLFRTQPDHRASSRAQCYHNPSCFVWVFPLYFFSYFYNPFLLRLSALHHLHISIEIYVPFSC